MGSSQGQSLSNLFSLLQLSTATTGNLYGLVVEATTVLVTSPVDAWYFLYTAEANPLYEDPRYKNLTHRHA